MAQTTVLENQVKFQEGQVLQRDLILPVVFEGATAGKEGLGVIQGTADNQVQVAQGVTFTQEKFGGVIVRSGTATKALVTGVTEVVAEEQISVLKQGIIVVKVTGTVTKDALVFMQFVANTGALGTFRGDADTASAVAIPARFLDSGVADDLVRIHVNAPLMV